MHLGRITIATVLLGSGLFAAPGVASAASPIGKCVESPLVGSVPSGSTLAPGQQIEVTVSQTVTGNGPVSECEDGLLDATLDFISGGAYGRYTTLFNGTIVVEWPGPIQPGTHLTDTLVLGVPVTDTAGTHVGIAVGAQVEANRLDYTVS